MVVDTMERLRGSNDAVDNLFPIVSILPSLGELGRLLEYIINSPLQSVECYSLLQLNANDVKATTNV